MAEVITELSPRQGRPRLYHWADNHFNRRNIQGEDFTVRASSFIASARTAAATDGLRLRTRTRERYALTNEFGAPVLDKDGKQVYDYRVVELMVTPIAGVSEGEPTDGEPTEAESVEADTAEDEAESDFAGETTTVGV